jgi:hypothetical protein
MLTNTVTGHNLGFFFPLLCFKCYIITDTDVKSGVEQFNKHSHPQIFSLSATGFKIFYSFFRLHGCSSVHPFLGHPTFLPPVESSPTLAGDVSFVHSSQKLSTSYLYWTLLKQKLNHSNGAYFCGYVWQDFRYRLILLFLLLLLFNSASARFRARASPLLGFRAFHQVRKWVPRPAPNLKG